MCSSHSAVCAHEPQVHEEAIGCEDWVYDVLCLCHSVVQHCLLNRTPFSVDSYFYLHFCLHLPGDLQPLYSGLTSLVQVSVCPKVLCVLSEVVCEETSLKFSGTYFSIREA